jgi:hypothetical protein
MFRVAIQVPAIEVKMYLLERSGTSALYLFGWLLVFSDPFDQRFHVVGVLLFFCEDLFQETAGGGIFFAKIADDLGIWFDCDAFSDKVLLDHLHERMSLNILGVTAHQQAFGTEVWRAIQLDDPFGYAVGVSLFFLWVLQKFLGDGLGVNPVCHVVVTLVAQHADDFGSQRFIQQSHRRLGIALIAFNYSALFDVLPGAASDFLDVA